MFRPFNLPSANMNFISQARFLCKGFCHSDTLARLTILTLKLGQELLSKQRHYNFGLWTVLQVIQLAGDLRQKYSSLWSSFSLSEILNNERQLVSRCLSRVLSPSLLVADRGQFMRLQNDSFSQHNHQIDARLEDVVEASIQQACQDLTLQATEYTITKVKEIHEVRQTSRGVMVIGDPLSGKTTALQILRHAKSTIRGGRDILCETVNPKALTLTQMFGTFDSRSAEWTDGVVPRILRNFTCSEKECWLIFDGPVDDCWAETLHALLDNNLKLSLPSGEVILMKHNTSIFFEVADLREASPGIISRCGFVYFNAGELGWRTLLRSWLQNESDTLWAQAEGQFVLDLMEWMIPAYENFLKQCTRLVDPGVNNIVRTTAGLFAMLLREACIDPEAAKHVRIWIQAALMLSGAWSFGGILDRESKEKFDEMLKTLWKGTSAAYPLPACLENKVDVPVPNEGQLVDHSFMFKFKGAWKYWPDALRSFKMEEKTNLLQLTVPTVDTARYLTLLEMHINTGTPLLLLGPRDTGKTTLIQHFLLEKMRSDYQPAIVRLTHHTSAALLQDEVISHLSKRKSGGFGPVPGKTSCVIFVDDLGMPAHETRGSQPPLELLRQILDHKSWFDQSNGSRVAMHDILVLGALSPHQNTVSTRLLRHFNIFSINPLPDDTVTRIFSSMLHVALKHNGFASDVASVITSIVQSTLDVLTTTSRKLRPTPSNPHYVFSLRDFQRVILGCAQIRKENAENKRVMVRLWSHEILRVVSDRLQDCQERLIVLNSIEHCVRETFKEQYAAVFEHLPKQNGHLGDESMNSLVFGNQLNRNVGKYTEITNNHELLNQAQAALQNYNTTNKLEIILFSQALQQLCRLNRILSMPRSSALLLGKLGRGRQSLAVLAAHVCGHRLITPSQSVAYSFTDWREDVKRAVRQAGAENHETAFLVNEAQLRNDQFLQDIHCILNAGEIPNLFSIEEKQDIMEAVMLDAQGGKRTVDLSPLVVLAFFAARCQDKLHWLICLDPSSPRFRGWLQRYPALLTHCTPIWFPEWPETAFEQISVRYTKTLQTTEELKSLAVVACQKFHQSARKLAERYYTEQGLSVEIATRGYVELLQLVGCLTKARQQRIHRDRQRYIVGLEKLQLAAAQVKRIQEELSSMQPKLVEAALETTGMLQVIETETQKVCEASLLVRRDEAIANTQAAAAQELKSECETELAQAIPILEDAVAALNTLKPTDITLVKSMKNPPEPIKLVMAAVCVIRNIKPDRLNDAATGRKIIDYWGPSKKLLGDIAFLQQLREFDKDNIPAATIAKIRKDFIPHPDFRPEIVANASSAAEGLCKWVRAMDMYDAVAKEVAPKKAKLEEAQQEYAATLAVLEEKRAQVRKLEGQLAELQAQFDAANLHKQQLEKEFQMCAHKLERAEKLIGGLSGEKDRWALTAKNLQTDIDTLLGDVLLSSAAITYLGPFTNSYRQQCLSSWVTLIHDFGIPCSSNYDFCRVMGNELEIEEWNLAGLPRDENSTKSAIIAQYALRVCLAIDPQNQAATWIRGYEHQHGLRELQYPNADFESDLNECIRDRVPALVSDLQGYDLDSLVSCFATRVNQHILDLGMSSDQEDAEKMSNFRLYLTTPQSQPCLSPEVFTNATVIDFTLSAEGLEDQLLGIIMAAERPALRRSRQQVVVEGAKNRAALKEVEERILTTLSQSEGNILEDEAAVIILDTAKTLSEELTQKQSGAVETLRDIAEFRSDHEAVARDTAVVFATLLVLPTINVNYQFSLSWFLQHFSESIRESSRIESALSETERAEGRQARLFNAFVNSLCHHLSQAIFESDFMPYMLLLCLKILRVRGQITDDELKFLFDGGEEDAAEIVTDSSDMEVQIPVASWLPDTVWKRVYQLGKLPKFQFVVESITEQAEKWRHATQDVDVPDYSNLLPVYHVPQETWQLCSFFLTSVFKADKVYRAAQDLIASELHIRDLHSSSSVIWALEQSTHLSPLICLLGPGVDPSLELFPLAEKQEHTTLYSISMAEDQGSVAEETIRLAMQRGCWVCLHNCQLASGWFRSLEKLCSQLNDANPAFRLWITCDARSELPASVMQRGVKLACEIPVALRASMHHSLMIQSPMFPECRGKEATFCRLAFGISFFHALMLGRGQFGDAGWSRPYIFSSRDLGLATKHVWHLCRENRRVPLDAAKTLIGECTYVGRVSDPLDRRILLLLSADCINEQLLTRPGYCLAETDGNRYKVPNILTLQYCLKQIEQFPEVTNSTIYGVHKRAGVKHDVKISQHVFQVTEGLLKLSTPLVSEHILLERSLRSYQLDECVQHLVLQITEIWNMVNIEAESNAQENVLNLILSREFEQLKFVVREAKSSLEGLQRVLRNGYPLSPKLESLVKYLSHKQIPPKWQPLDETTTISKFIPELQMRFQAFQCWLQGGTQTSYWLSGMLHPASFLAALKLEHANAMKTSLGAVQLEFRIMDFYEAAQHPQQGVYIHGLYLDGAIWDITEGHLVEQQSGDSGTAMLPVLWVKPVCASESTADLNGTTAYYTCPLYSSPDKKEPSSIIAIMLKCNQQDAPDIFMRRGVSLYLRV